LGINITQVLPPRTTNKKPLPSQQRF